MQSLARIGRGLLAGAALAMLSCNTTKDGLRVSAIFETAQGLKRGAAVEIAGVQVGDVEDVRLDRMKARVAVRIDRGVEVGAQSEMRIDNRGLMGEKIITLLPVGGPNVADRAELRAVGSNDELTGGVARVIGDVQTVTSDVKAITAILRKAAEKDGPAGLRPMLGDPAAKPAP